MKNARRAGFTLVEMAIVLVIIGIILSAVMKGRDLVRSAQTKQYAQGFVQKWVTIAKTYQDKTGHVLYDGRGNGGRMSHVTEPDGIMDGMVLPKKWHSRCEPLYEALIRVGIDPCTLIKSDLNDFERSSGCANKYDPFARTVHGEYTGVTTMYVGFWGLKIGAGGPARNCVIFGNVPSDIAQGLDTTIDGVADGRAGSVVCLSALNDESDSSGDTWPLIYWEASTYEQVTPVAWPNVGGQPRWCIIAVALD